jgi:hypothetical protein
VVRKVPKSQWVIKENEALRIIPEELWVAVHAERRRRSEGKNAAKTGGMNRTPASQKYLFSGHLQCGLCGGSISISDCSGGKARYGCHVHRYHGTCKNAVVIYQHRLEAQLLDKLVASLHAPEHAALIAEEFERQLVAAQKAEALAAQEVLCRRDELLEERALLTKKVANLTDAIALHGISGALSSQLSQAEKRLDVVTGLLKPKANAETVSTSPAQIRDFLARQMAKLAEVLTGDPIRAKQEISRRINQLVLTPESRDGRNVFVVTGDLRLFATAEEEEVMPINSGVGIVEHYKLANISLDGLVLEPKLPKAA